MNLHVRMIDQHGNVYEEFDLSEVSPVDVYHEGRPQCRLEVHHTESGVLQGSQSGVLQGSQSGVLQGSVELSPEGILFTEPFRPANKVPFTIKLTLAAESGVLQGAQSGVLQGAQE